MGLDFKTLAASKKYTEETAEGMGAIKGKDGKDGESAYQIAIDNGFVGSQAQWLESLKGENGQDGTDGFSPIITPSTENTPETYKLDITTVDGTFITDNLKGERGFQGIQGIPGIQGEPGAPGQQGIQGIQGVQGDPFLIYKEYDNLEEFNPLDFRAVGQMFGVKPSLEGGNYDVYRYAGEDEPQYTFVTSLGQTESIKGEPGLQGEQGIPGVDGKDGTTYTPTVTAETGDDISAVVELDEEEKTANFLFTFPDFALKGNAGCDLALIVDPVDYVMTLQLKNADGTVLSSKTVDFPLESMVIGASYDESTGELTLNLQNGQTLEPIKISKIVGGLVTDERKIAGLDLKDDITADELKHALDIKPYTPVIGDIEIGEEAQASVELDEENLEAAFNFTLPKGDKGDTPYIKDGNWWYGDTDSGVPIPSFLDLLNYVDEAYGIQDTPIGHILTHMGNNAPKHYLKCDGAIYKIGTFPYLEKHFKNEFGIVNYFGGDGINTFAVPDLRGEFLRGAGANSHEYSGAGAEVGIHQNPTYHPGIYTDGGGSITWQLNSHAWDVDTAIYTYAMRWQGSSGQAGNQEIQTYSARPTNTSVLYCIKYEPTYFMVINGKT